MSVNNNSNKSEQEQYENTSISIVAFTELTEFDVLFGRGSGITKMAGNQKFHRLVDQHRAMYRAAVKTQKLVISKHVIAMVHAKGGRFLKMMDDYSNSNSNIKLCITVSQIRAQEKTSQALREQKFKHKWQCQCHKPRNPNKPAPTSDKRFCSFGKKMHFTLT